MLNQLTDDFILFEILARLPLKFLLRLTLICKRWHFLITNPGSIQFHSVHASYNLHNSSSFVINTHMHHVQTFGRETFECEFSIVNKDHNNILIKCINDSIHNICKQILSFYDSLLYNSMFKPPEPNFSVNPEKPFIVIGSVHGLVCFRHVLSCGLFFIWNPFTKMLKTVTNVSGKKKISDCKSAFYYDSVDKDFRIIEFKVEVGSLLYRIEVYSCNLDTWTEIRDDSLPNSQFYIAANANGNLYLYFFKKRKVLVAFNVHDQVFKRIPCALYSIEGATKYSLYINWKDSLGVAVLIDPESDNRGCVVYTYDDTSCIWTKKYIAPDSLDSCLIYLGLENDDVVVVNHKGDSLMLFEHESSQFKDLVNTSVLPCSGIMRYTETLVCIKGMQVMQQPSKKSKSDMSHFATSLMDHIKYKFGYFCCG